MKKIIIVLLLAGFTKVYAQEPVKFGVKAGLNLNTSGDIYEIISSNPSLPDLDLDGNLNGFNVGIYSEIKLLMLYLRPELNYSKFKDNLKMTQSRIEAPISLGLKVLPILSGFAGPTLRYEMKKDDLFQTSTKDLTVGIHFGARLHLGKLGLDVRYDQGVSEEMLFGGVGSTSIPATFDNSPGLVSLGLSYAF
jgi:hypothetical protein